MKSKTKEIRADFLFFIILIGKYFWTRIRMDAPILAVGSLMDVFFLFALMGVGHFVGGKKKLLIFGLTSLLEGGLLVMYLKTLVGNPLNLINILLFLDAFLLLGLFFTWRPSRRKAPQVRMPIAKILAGVLAGILIFSMNSTFVQGAVFSAPGLGQKVLSLTKLPAAAQSGVQSPTLSPGENSGVTPTPEVKDTLTGIAKGKNVIVIQLEAFQNIVIGKSLNGIEITPNLNKLIKESVYFQTGISQIASGNTSDAEFLTNTSLYPLEKESPFKKYATKDYKGLPYIMKQNGYYSATFHTNDATFWNRKNMYPKLGFNRWYDKVDFPAKEVVGYGASDNVLFAKVMEKLKLMRSKNTPVYYNVITLSNHHPFRTPTWMNAKSFGKAADATDAGRYVRTANYTDRQLGIFFDALKKENMYEDALIVIYGDHFGISTKTDEDKKVIESFLGRPYDALDSFNVPLIFKLPNEKRVGTEIMPAGQVDIMPTILNLVGLENKDRKMYGQDLLNTTENTLGLRFYASANTYIDNTGLYTGTGKYIPLDHTEGEALPADEAKVKALYQRIGENDAYLKKIPVMK